MKMRPEHYDHVKAALIAKQAHYPEQTRQYYVEHNIGKDNDMRHRWDLFHAAGLSRYACDVLYAYLTDEHIDTALRAIVREMESA